MSEFKVFYESNVAPELMKQLELRNSMMVPRVEKVVINMGTGIVDKDVLKQVTDDLGAICGQCPVVTKARRSISNFKLREGMSIGSKVTLRRTRMYEFLDRLINSALPRIRDFRGVPASGFDGRGNYTLGIKDQSIFPEIDPNRSAVTQGMNITIVTSAQSDADAKALLSLLGMPFVKN